MGRGSESISDPVFGAGSRSVLVVAKRLGNAGSGGPGTAKGDTGAIESLLRNTEGALKPESVSTKQERIAKLVRNNPAMRLREFLSRRVSDGVCL